MAKPTTIVAVVGDRHSNSTTGLCPPVVLLDDLGEYHQSPLQAEIWDYWLDLAKHLKKLKRKRKARLVVVDNGDGSDRNSHCAHQLVSVNRATIVRLSAEACIPLREIADEYIVNRGTSAHEGGSGELAELVAARVNATQDKDGSYSHWWPKLTIAGVRFLIGHRPISNSTREHLRGAGARRTAYDIWASAMRMGDTPPDVAVFSHVHHWAEGGGNYSVRAYYTPPWQQCTNYGFNIAKGYLQEPVGAWIFECEDGEYTARLWQRQPKVREWRKL